LCATSIADEYAPLLKTKDNNTCNFLKGAKWSPDGICLLSNSEDNVLRLFEPKYDSNQVQDLKAIIKNYCGDTIYDFCWYPNMSTAIPATCCYLSTSKDHPVQLWDAFNGNLRASYSAYDNADELTAAYSLAFDITGSQIYSGYLNYIRIFDINRPSDRPTELKTTTKESPFQKGIISCIKFNYYHPTLFAASSYLKTIGLYSTDGSAIDLLQGQHIGGITHLVFSPDGNYLLSGARKDPYIICWDLRNLNQALCKWEREVSTNQRIYFDMDPTGKYLITGNTNNKITIFNTTDVSKPKLVIYTNKDSINGVAFHPYNTLIASTSGQRKFILSEEYREETDNDQLYTVNSIDIWQGSFLSTTF